MASKITLGKLKRRSDSSYSSSFAFRFNPNEEDLEEIPGDDFDSTSDKITTETVHSDPIKLVSNQNFNLTLDERKHHSSGSQEDADHFHSNVCALSSSEPQVTEGVLQNMKEVEVSKAPERKKMVERAKSATFPDSQSKTSESTVESTSSGSTVLEGRGSSDSSPMKESVRDYLITKLSKRSASFDCSSQILESDTWSLFSGIKGRIAKTFEERKNRDLSSGSLSNSSKCSDKRDLDQISVDSFDTDNSVRDSTPSSESTAAALSDYTPEAEEGCSAEIFFQTAANQEQGSTNSHYTLVTSTSLSKTTDSIDGSTFPRKTKPPSRIPMSMTLSSLMATKSLESDILEEDENQCAPNFASEKSADIVTLLQQETELNTQSAKDQREKVEKQSFVHCIYEVKDKYKQWWNYCNEMLHKLKDKKVTVVGVCFLMCAIAPFPSYFSGFVSGFMLAALIGSVLNWLFRPAQHHVATNILTNVPPSPFEFPGKGDEKVKIYKGWMNQLPVEYCLDTYHINMTHSVYVRLEGTSLRLSRPKCNIPKRAMWNECRHELSFVHQRHFDVANASVTLLPKGLARKRLWSKKYPICIVIQDAFGLSQPKIEVAKDCLSSLDSSPVDSCPVSSDESSPVSSVSDKVTLYLFSRTDREKEEWYRRFEAAAQLGKETPHSWSLEAMPEKNNSIPRSVSVSLGSQSNSTPANIIVKEDKIDFFKYMSTLLQPDNINLINNIHQGKMTMHEKKASLRPVSSLSSISEEATNNVAWLNALIGRILYDFLTQPCWSEAVSNKIQRKLSKIKIPYFIEELTLTDIHLGKALPQVCKTYSPAMDERGVWIDIDIAYTGIFQMTLETKLNLMRLGKRQTLEMMEFSGVQQEIERVVNRSHVYNSDEEDSAESSSDEDLNPTETESTEESNVGSSAGKRILRIVDKIAQSRYFQQAAEYKYIKKAMEGVSNTPIVLTVEVHNLVGRLVLNIPPPPTDRLWYGFRGNPQLTISARPKLGEHVVTLSQVTEWIEKKLLLEFQKLLVLPNMDDLPIPVMYSGLSRS